MVTKSVTKRGSKAVKRSKRVKDLPLKADRAKSVKGGLTFGDIKGESTDKDHKDW